MLNYGKRLEHVRAKQLVACLYLYHMTIGNRQKDLILIPFTAKHITKCLCFRLKKTYKFSMVTIIFVEWNRPSREFTRPSTVTQYNEPVVIHWKYTLPRIKRWDNKPLSNFANTKEPSRGWEDKFAISFVQTKKNANLSSSTFVLTQFVFILNPVCSLQFCT